MTFAVSTSASAPPASCPARPRKTIAPHESAASFSSTNPGAASTSTVRSNTDVTRVSMAVSSSVSCRPYRSGVRPMTTTAAAQSWRRAPKSRFVSGISLPSGCSTAQVRYLRARSASGLTVSLAARPSSTPMERHGVMVLSKAGGCSCLTPNTATGSGAQSSCGSSGSVRSLFCSSTIPAAAAARAVSAWSLILSVISICVLLLFYCQCM